MENASLLISAGLAFFAAGTVKGIAGLGMPTAAIALITLFEGPRVAIALVLFPMLAANMWQLWRGGLIHRTAQRYWLFALVLFCGVMATAFGTAGAGDQILLGALGVVVLIFVAASVRRMIPPLPERLDRAAQVGFGLFAGVIGGMTAAWGPPLAMYLATREVDKDEFIRATGFLIVVGSIPLCLSYAQLGFLSGPLAGVSVAMILPTILGFTVGERLRGHLSPEGFRNAILIVFAILGLNLIRRAIWYT
ncbi:MAG: sulfite exporter TauE/SafE family protein [Pseudomonadota bacterium]